MFKQTNHKGKDETMQVINYTLNDSEVDAISWLSVRYESADIIASCLEGTNCDTLVMSEADYWEFIEASEADSGVPCQIPCLDLDSGLARILFTTRVNCI